MLTDDTIPEEIATVERLRGLRDLVTTQMGGPEAVDAIHAAGRRTAREHIAELADAGSFREIGTFATATSWSGWRARACRWPPVSLPAGPPARPPPAMGPTARPTRW